jgi:hypothetical protein
MSKSPRSASRIETPSERVPRRGFIYRESSVMSRRVVVLVSFALLSALAGAGCGSPSDGATKPAPASAASAGSGAAATGGVAGAGHGGASASAAAPHGDHSPHHGGTVLMAGDLHYEIVLKPAGGAELYLSDAVRKELPASIVSDVAIEIERPGKKDEQIDMTVDGSGERWEGPGAPVKQDDAIVRVAFTFQGDPVTVDLPYRSYFKPAAKPAAKPAP